MGLFRLTRRSILAACLLTGLALPVYAQTPVPLWVTVWSSAQMTPGTDSALSPDAATDATLRQTIHIAKGGKTVRLHLSNIMGTEPLRLNSIHIAVASSTGSPQIDPASDRTVTFAGLSDIVIPAGADFLSDPIALTIADQSALSVSFHMPEASKTQTGHPGSRTTSWLVRGNHAADADLSDTQSTQHFDHWFNIAGVDVQGGTTAVVAFGDSITDGYGIKPNTDTRWPDFLNVRLKDEPITVLNSGIGGNRLLLDGLGNNALARFERDILSHDGVRYVIVLEGVNDLGMLTRDAPVTPEAHTDMVRQITAAYLQMIAKAHNRGLKIYGSTITPFMGMDYYHPDAINEADRQAVNQWIKTSGAFDAVIDFDAALRDPAQPDRLLPAYDGGDHLHPSQAGYKAMADAVDLRLFSH